MKIERMASFRAYWIHNFMLCVPSVRDALQSGPWIGWEDFRTTVGITRYEANRILRLARRMEKPSPVE